MSLRTLQKRFSLALLDRTREVPHCLRAASRRQVERRFNLYRNNVFVSLTEALLSRFPVCHALVGDEFFRAMARMFIELSPPRSPVLVTYGDDFGDFIETFPPARSVPYLGDVARLEAARTRAYHAADANPLTVGELETLAPYAWELARVVLHPSIQVIRSSHPIVTIWEAHVLAEPLCPIDGSIPEDALIARPGLEVEIHRLPPGGAVFILSLMSEATFGEAADKAAMADPRFDLVTSLSVLLAHHLIVGVSGPLHLPSFRA